MSANRRRFLTLASHWGIAAMATLSGLAPRLARAVDSRAAFEAADLKAALAAIGVKDMQDSTEITLKTPEIAENGAVVPVEVSSALPGTRSIALLVEKNPHQLSAEFTIPEGTDPFVATRVKVAETSLIHAVVKTDAGVFHAARTVKVTLGGCGG